jgi:hypothetical protein
MRKLCAAFIVLLALSFGASTASAQVRTGEAYSYSYSSNGFSGSSYSSGPVSSGRWEYVPGGVDANGFRIEPKLVQRQDPYYGSSGYYRSSETWSRNSSSRSYTYTDSNGTFYRYESSGRHSSYYSERYTPRR